MTETPADPPVVTVVAGSPTPEELAAIIAVLTAASASDPEVSTERSDRPLGGGWKSYIRTLRRSHNPGPGAWRHADR